MSLVLEENPSHWKKQYEYSGPALTRAGHNAKPRRVAPLSSGCMTSLFSVNFLNESRNVYNGDPSREWKCQVMSVKPNWQENCTYNAITSLLSKHTFVRRRANLEKTVNMSHELMSSNADAFW